MRSETLNQIVNGYAVLLASFWLFDLTGSTPISNEFGSFVESTKWFLTMPAIFGTVLYLGFALLDNVSDSATRFDREDSQQSRTAQASRRVENVGADSPSPEVKIKNPTKTEPEKREAEKSLEVPAFPPVEKTRGPQEALDALLDEF